MADLQDLLNAAPDGAWRPRAPADPAQLAALESRLGHMLPDPHRRLLLTSDGGTLTGPREQLVLHEVARMLDTLDDDAEVQAGLPGMIVFGENEAGAFYYYDPTGRLGRGAWAVYWNELGSLGFADSRFAGSDLAEVVRRILDGVLFFDEPELGEQAGG